MDAFSAHNEWQISLQMNENGRSYLSFQYDTTENMLPILVFTIKGRQKKDQT